MLPIKKNRHSCNKQMTNMGLVYISIDNKNVVDMSKTDKMSVQLTNN